jgi:hypothetical protein
MLFDELLGRKLFLLRICWTICCIATNLLAWLNRVLISRGFSVDAFKSNWLLVTLLVHLVPWFSSTPTQSAAHLLFSLALTRLIYRAASAHLFSVRFTSSRQSKPNRWFTCHLVLSSLVPSFTSRRLKVARPQSHRHEITLLVGLCSCAAS